MTLPCVSSEMRFKLKVALYRYRHALLTVSRWQSLKTYQRTGVICQKQIVQAVQHYFLHLIGWSVYLIPIQSKHCAFISNLYHALRTM